MTKVLVTGASGFIGQHTLPLLLEADREVHAVTRQSPTSARWHRADLLDEKRRAELLADVKPQELLHFAWYVVPTDYRTSPENRRWVEASLGLMRDFAAHGGRRVVMAGTCFEYDLSAGECREDTPLRPESLYAECKAELFHRAGELAAQLGLSWAWGRIFYLYGPGEAPARLVASVVRSLLSEQPALCSHGEQVRDFLHVHDVAAGFVSLLRSDLTGAVNIGSGEGISIRELVNQIARKLERPEQVRFGAVGAPAGDPPRVVADISKLRSTGWSPGFDLDTGLRDTIEYWRQSAAARA